MKFSKERWLSARDFMEQEARPLEQARFAYHFTDGERTAVLTELAAFQNEDGGFGHGLEPDVCMADSSVIAATVALQIAREVDAPPDAEPVQGAIRYLLATYDADAMAWPIVPPAVEDAPHAPWWQYKSDLNEYLANPRAEIVGHFWAYQSLVPADLLSELTTAVTGYALHHSDDLEMHDLLCYVRLLETEALPDTARDQMLPVLRQVVDRLTATDPAAWAQYGLKPLAVAPLPDSLFASQLSTAIAANLDYEIEQQQENGAWPPSWTWGDFYPAAWPQAMRDWQGIITLQNLRSLRGYGRFGDWAA